MDLPVTAPRFTIGRTLRDTLRISGRYFQLVGAVIVTRFIVSWAIVSIPLEGEVGTIFWVSAAIQLLGNHLVEALAAAIVVFGTIEALQGRKPSFRDMVRGFSYLHLIFMGGLLMGVFEIAATIVNVTYPTDSDMVTLGRFGAGFGALFLTLYWGLYVPAIALEGKGPLQAMHRSYRLMEDHRGTIFLLLLILELGVFVVLAAGTQVVTRAGIALIGAFDMMSYYSTSWIGPVMLAMLGLISTVSNILPVVIYHHLRIDKEGDYTDTTVQAFD
jgi:hypothetical protein